MEHMKRHLLVVAALIIAGAAAFYCYRVRQNRDEVMVQSTSQSGSNPIAARAQHDNAQARRHNMHNQSEKSHRSYEKSNRRTPSSPQPDALA